MYRVFRGGDFGVQTENNAMFIPSGSDDLLRQLEPVDPRGLLSAAPGATPGCLLRLNRSPRYHNSLDAIVLALSVLEWRSERSRRSPECAQPVSSPDLPASSDRSSQAPTGSGTFVWPCNERDRRCTDPLNT